ncbi:VanZ family protein [Shewanella sedimentimangrovi]|uniref:VanZ family protein n=1 Tax=Shewanella sedimentimangrovi TaxID=2814293 RepID=A0ABX7QXQ0_9GAMM|nr:VanZ family protein [Shewanella sedimentimangrovi]QSX36302.1 VanZ family protein [Shewanella sedimentimangrovi]
MNNSQTFFKWVLLLALLGISYLVFSKPNYPQTIPNIDKIGHFGSFFLLAWLTQLAFRPNWPQLTLALGAYAGLIEAVQSRLPYRSASWGDMAADMAGVLAFYICLWLYQRYRRAAQLEQ